MKRVLFMIPNLGHGGAEKVLVNLVNHMDKNKFDITVMTLYDEGVNKSSLSSEIRYLSCFKRSFLGVAHLLKLVSPEKLYSWFVKDEYDIVISYLEGQTARIVSGCKNPNTKLVSWIHCTMNKSSDLSVLFRNLNEAIDSYGSMDTMVFVSEDVKDSFLNVSKYSGTTRVLYNTLDSSKIKELSNHPLYYEIKKDKFNLIGVGSLKEVKGFLRLLHVVRKLNDLYPVHLYILGEGPQRNELETYISKHELNSTVTLIGYDENPYKHVSKCDLFVCSSYSEGFSTAATEALIVGTPVCTVEVSGMNEMLGKDSEYGLIVENNEDALFDGIKKLIEDKELYCHYREKAVERGQFFSSEETVKAVEEMLLNL